MMKLLLASLVLLTGCVTSGMQSLETKYVPGDCVKITEEALKTYPQDKQAFVKSAEGYVQALFEDGYFVLLVGPKGPFATQSVTKEELNSTTELTQCKYILPKTKKD